MANSSAYRWGALRLLLIGVAVTAVFAPPTSRAQAPGEKCGADSGQPRPMEASAASGAAHRGRYPGAVSVPIAIPGSVTELPAPVVPAAPGKETPTAPTPTATQAPPSGSTPPPAVPGLVPARRKDDDDDRKRVAARQAQGEVPEGRLLDVGIELFAPGVDEGDRAKLAKVGLSPELRRSEARFVAFHLKKTLESTGYWGAVRVLPAPGEGVDLTVTGRIRESNGKRLALDVEAHDATGRKWLTTRYRGEADTSAYRADRVGRQEAFQELYNRIANDLLSVLEDRGDEELAGVRQVAGLRFASQLLPEAFAPYLKTNGSGRYGLARAPAAEDPMVRRVATIRERDQMLVDTLNDHYLVFYEKMSGPYANWKMYSHEEQDALDRINRESLLKKILGGAAVLTGILLNPENQGQATVKDAAMIGGGLLIESGFRAAQEKGVHQAALKELAGSFDGDVTPMLVEVEGQQVKLTGPAETQFAAWRDLLRQVLSLETGAPTDPNGVLVMAPSPRP
jgi:hypothetical protein